MSTVVVTGASGLLGGNLAITLLQQGHEVRATRRAGSRVRHLDAFPIQWVEADLGDPGRLCAAFNGAQAVFHCAAAVTVARDPTPEVIATNVTGTRNVLDAARAVGVERVVHCSSVVAVGLSTDGQPCDERAPFNLIERGLSDGYVVTKRQAEQVVAEAVARGQDALIVNPTYMIGPYDAKPSSGRLLIEIVRRRVPGWGPGRNNLVDVRDVAVGMILAWQRGRAGERYILGGETLRYPEIGARVAAVAGVAPITRMLPRAPAMAVGALAEFGAWALRREATLNRAVVAWAFCEDFHFTWQKAASELGYSPGPIEPAIADALAWFRDNGML